MKQSYLLIILVFTLARQGYLQVPWKKVEPGLCAGFTFDLYPDEASGSLFLVGIMVKTCSDDTLFGIAYSNGYDIKTIPQLSSWISGYQSRSIIRYKGDLYLSALLDSPVHGFGILKRSEDNHQWNIIQPGNLSMDIIYQMEEHDGKLYFGGDTYYSGSKWFGGIVEYDGIIAKQLMRPDTIDPPNAGFRLVDMEWYQGNLFVSGNINYTNSMYEKVRDFGYIVNGELTSLFEIDWETSFGPMAVYKDELYITGGFTTIHGMPSNFIMKWDGAQLKPVGGGLNAGVRDLVVYNNILFIVGDFTHADNGTVYCPKIVAWDGENWIPFNDYAFGHGTGISQINDIAFLKDELYVTGMFHGSIGGDTIMNFAKYIRQIPGEENALEVWMNNSNEEIIVQYESNEEYSLFVAISNISGQRIKTVTFNQLQGYTHQVVSLPDLAAGVYIVEAMANNKKVCKKFMKFD